MQRIINIVSLVGWTYLLIQTDIQLIFNLQNYLVSDISLSLTILRAVQLLQVFDILFIVLGMAKGNVVASFFQILGRNFVTLFVMEQQSGRFYFAFVVVVWSIADANRYLYYLFKHLPITGLLRYNGFLLLYPLGGVAESLIINDYINRHPDITDIHRYFLRFANFCIIIGVVVLYKYMLSARKKYYAGLAKQTGAQSVEAPAKRRQELKRD